MTRHDFRSDNVGGAAPELLAALNAASAGTAAPYGEDPWTQRCMRQFSACFEREVAVFPLASGTGANAVSLAALSRPWGAIYCHETAHVNVHECGAVEFFSGGARLVGLAGEHYKIDPQRLAETLRLAGAGSPTRVQPCALHLTQPTDFGTLYTLEELRALTQIARSHGLAVHMDGARFANAVAALGCTPAELSWRSGVDLLSFGATKNGAINAEAIVVFDPALAAELPYRLKRGGQVLSKSRFVSAQLERYLAGDEWLQRARSANALARDLALGLQALPGVTLTAPVEINMVFARVPAAAIAALRAAPFDFYELGPDLRFVCRHDQAPEGIASLLDCLSSALRG